MHEWLDELRLEPGPPYLAMGTHALRLDEWLIVDDQREADLAYKARLLTAEHDTVFAATEHSHAASSELLELVRAELDRRGIAPVAPGSLIGVVEHPLVQAARLVQEDLAIMQRVECSWVLTAGAVCFPTHWTVTDKIGLAVAQIHQPVAHYPEELQEKVDRFHDRLTVEHPVWRRNWFVLATNELHLPDREDVTYARQAVTSIAPDGSPLWIRSERQTLRRLPQSDAIVFTIRVQQAPLSVLLERRDLAGAMLAATRSWDDAKRRYTSTGGVLDKLIDWLDAVALDTSAAPG
jgi:Haem-dependent oxidative N-demethylase, alpha subunit-like